MRSLVAMFCRACPWPCACAVVLGCLVNCHAERAVRQQDDLARLMLDSNATENSAGAASAGSSAVLIIEASGNQTITSSARLAVNASASTRLAASASAGTSVNHTGSAAARAEGVAANHVQGNGSGGASSDAVASSLKSATVQAHTALMHAAAALAEQQSHQGQGQQGASQAHAQASGKEEPKSDQNASAGPADSEKAQEEKLEKEEESTLGSSLGKMATAFTDPRKFLMEMPGMKDFSAGIKAAVDMGPEKGKCLTTGEFAGFGCGDDKDSPKICSCGSVLELCWLPEDPKAVVDRFTKGQTKEAFAEAKALLFGQCYRSHLLMAALGLGGLVVVLILLWVVKSKVFGKQRPS